MFTVTARYRLTSLVHQVNPGKGTTRALHVTEVSRRRSLPVGGNFSGSPPFLVVFADSVSRRKKIIFAIRY